MTQHDTHLGLFTKIRWGNPSSKIGGAATGIKLSITATVTLAFSLSRMYNTKAGEVILEILPQHSVANALLDTRILSGVDDIAVENNP